MRGNLYPVVLVTLTLLCVGCRFPLERGPVPRSLIASRHLCGQGVSALEANEWQRAEKLLARAVKTCHFDPDARRHYATVLWHQGRREKAVGQLEEASRLAIDNAMLHVLIAEMRLEIGQLEAAWQHAQSAVDLDPTLANAWKIRGRVLLARGEPKEALADHHRALTLAPDDPDIKLEIAELYRQLNQPRRALATLLGLARNYSPGEEPQQLLYLEGLAYGALERWDDAADTFAAATERPAATAEIYFRLAEAQWFAGRPTAAAAAAQEALALMPEHRPSRNLLDQALLALGQDKALRR